MELLTFTLPPKENKTKRKENHFRGKTLRTKRLQNLYQDQKVRRRVKEANNGNIRSKTPVNIRRQEGSETRGKFKPVQNETGNEEKTSRQNLAAVRQ